VIKPAAMRWLDSILGGAVCFALTRLFPSRPARQIEPPAIRPVLFIGLAEMGSVVLTEPALLRARDVHHALPHFLIFAQNRDSLALTGTVPPTQTFTLRTDSLLALAIDTLRFMRWARRHGIAATVDTDPCSHFSAILARLSGAAIRAGFRHGSGQSDDRATLFTHACNYHPDLHLAQNLIALTDAALGTTSDQSVPAPPALPVIAHRPIDATIRSTVEARLRLLAPSYQPALHRILLVNPNIGDLLPQRRWPQEHYTRLIRAILDGYDDVFVFLIGTKNDTAATAALAAELGDRRCVAIAGAFALTELPALFACSTLLLTSDSGPAHFAAVTSMPVVVLFGPETSARYRPLGDATALAAGLHCSPCISLANRRHTDCRDNQCMRAISVATVQKEVEQKLNAASRYEIAG
jgi:ADP-heptose:LPS heptosyltransferase